MALARIKSAAKAGTSRSGLGGSMKKGHHQNQNQQPQDDRRGTSGGNNLYTAEEIQEYRQVFSVFDTDNSGAIGMEELKEAMKRLGINMNEKELENLIQEVDEDGNGEIDFGEFCTVMKRLSAKKVSWDEIIRQCFEVFDQHKTGMITESEFRNVLKNIGGIVDDDTIEQIFQEVDVDGNGVIDYDEFSSMVRNYMEDSDVET